MDTPLTVDVQLVFKDLRTWCFAVYIDYPPMLQLATGKSDSVIAKFVCMKDCSAILNFKRANGGKLNCNPHLPAAMQTERKSLLAVRNMMINCCWWKCGQNQGSFFFFFFFFVLCFHDCHSWFLYCWCVSTMFRSWCKSVVIYQMLFCINVCK